MEQTRAEKIQVNMENTDEEIVEYNLIIHKLENIKGVTKDTDIKIDINELIKKFESQVKFREDIKENDEQILKEII